jgi:hypothetical protein
MNAKSNNLLFGKLLTCYFLLSSVSDETKNLVLSKAFSGHKPM